MSFGQKPSAWARPQGSQQQQLNPNLFGNQLGLGPGQAFSAIPGMPLNSGLAGLVNQAAFTNPMSMGAMNSMLAQAQRSQMMPPQQQMQQRQQAQQQQTASPSRSQRTFIGQVTKLMETYGFVDEDVFFQTNVIRGSMPRVGDRVMVEATYNPSMPFKWNANRIQLIQENTPHQISRPAPQQQNGTTGGGSRWGGNERMVREEPRRQPPPVARRSPPREPPAKRPISRQRSPPLPRRSPPRKRDISPPRRQELPSKRDREERSAVDREKDRGDSTARGRSPAHSVKRDTDSPPRRRQRIIPRYHCNLSKQIIPSGDYKYASLHRRYDKLYIPSDFICSEFEWTKSIHLQQPIKFSPYPITFHVLHKDVDIPTNEGEQLPSENPPDADYRYVVKVLLISHPGLSVLRQKLSGLLPDGSIDESTETQPLIKNIQLLVGHRGKGEYMCIGGGWSPLMDGPEPLHPQTMVKTAVRCVRALTGLDLSNCSKWYKMVHLRYYRIERQRVDSVVLMLPDTGAVPGFRITDESFQAIEQAHRDQLASKLSAIDAEVFCPPNQQQQVPPPTQEEANDASSQQNVASDEQQHAQGGEQEQTQNVVVTPIQEQNAATDGTETAAVAEAAPEAMDTTIQNEQDQLNASQESLQTPTSGKKDGPTHWSSLLESNIRAMKVHELQEELKLRELNWKGLKNILMQRLLDAVEKEKEADPKKDEHSAAASITTAANANGTADSEQPQADSEPDQQEIVKELSTNEEQQSVEPTAAVTEPQKEKQSIVVKIKEEIVELMETDEAAGDVIEKKDETDEKKEAREKAEKERQELEKAKEKFEKSKKERKASLERHYGQIPKEQGIFVYPSKTAKSGKFDCKLMSLHSLLDYRPDDSKEASFEVFLFAESLKEVLDRSHAFTVYHTISTALDKDAEKKRRNEALSEACKDDDVVILDEAAAGTKKEDKGKEEGGEKVGGDKPKLPSNNIDLRTNFKALVHDMDTFTAFAHFDTNICGYLTDRDLEEIIYSVGLDISRAEVQRLVKKLSSKDRVNYRDLTDKWVDKDGNVKYIPSPTYENSIQSYEEHATGHLEKLAETTEQSDAGAKIPEQNANDTGVVFYKGMLVNVKHCLEQQTLMEQNRQQVLDNNKQLELQLNSTKEQRDQLEKKKRRLEDDLDRYKKKLHETERNLKKEQEDNGAAKKSLQDCKRYGERIVGIVDSIYPPPKPKEEKEKSVTKTAKENSVVGSNNDAAGGGADSDIVMLDSVGGDEKAATKTDNEEAAAPPAAKEEEKKANAVETAAPTKEEKKANAEKTTTPAKEDAAMKATKDDVQQQEVEEVIKIQE